MTSAVRSITHCPPAESEIAAALCVSPPSVNQMVKSLEKKGLVAVEETLASRDPLRAPSDKLRAEFAGRSSTIACECPLQVTELLMQLSHFEAYSAECRQRSPADAELHAYLQQVAATSRARFEAALEHVALHEGLILPPSSPPSLPTDRRRR